MFISESEAKQRLENSRNIFSPSYVREDVREDRPRTSEPQTDNDDGDSPKGSHISRNETEDSPLADPEIKSDDQISKENINKIDKLIAGAVDPYQVRQRTRNLRGQIDTQVAIGTTAFLLGNNKAGDLYDLSRSQAQAYSHGLSSTEDMREVIDRVPDRMRRLKSVKEQLAEKAAKNLNTALDSLTEDKIEGCSAVRISSIAKDMAVVMDKVSKDHDKVESIHFHLWKPEMKQVSEYTTVHVSSPLIIPNDGGS